MDELLDFPPIAMLQIITAGWVSQCVYVAAKLGIAEHISGEPLSISGLANRLQVNEDALYRVMRLLSSHKIFEEREERAFVHTPMSECLKPDAFGSVRAMAILCGEEHYAAWGQLLHSVKTGQPSFPKLFHQSVWEFLSKDKYSGEIFDEAMAQMASLADMAVVSSYDFSRFVKIVDVGGGQGALLRSILTQYESARGVVFELPSVAENAQKTLKAAGLSERGQALGGDFFAEVPEGDLFLLARVLQNFTDAQCVTLLTNCQRAMHPDARLLVIEMIIPPGNAPFFGKLSDLNMLVMTGGRERTKEEYRALFEAAGLTLVQEISTGAPVSVLEAKKASEP